MVTFNKGSLFPGGFPFHNHYPGFREAPLGSSRAVLQWIRAWLTSRAFGCVRRWRGASNLKEEQSGEIVAGKRH